MRRRAKKNKDRQEERWRGVVLLALGPDFNFSGVPVPRTESLVFVADWKQPCVARVCSAEVKGGGGQKPPVFSWDVRCRTPSSQVRQRCVIWGCGCGLARCKLLCGLLEQFGNLKVREK